LAYVHCTLKTINITFCPAPGEEGGGGEEEGGGGGGGGRS